MSLSLFISRFNNYIDISAARVLNPSSLGCPNGIRTCNVMKVSDFLTLNVKSFKPRRISEIKHTVDNLNEGETELSSRIYHI